MASYSALTFCCANGQEEAGGISRLGGDVAPSFEAQHGQLQGFHSRVREGPKAIARASEQGKETRRAVTPARRWCDKL